MSLLVGVLLVMLQTPFITSMDKLALAVSSSVTAKELTVKEDGIGEDININLYLWQGAYLVAICQMSTATMQKSHAKRFACIVDVMIILRQSLCIDAVTMIAEGYVSIDPSKTLLTPLDKAFVELPEAVKECLTFTHVYGDQVLFVTKPYKYTTPRAIIWEDEIYLPHQTIMRGGNSKYPLMLSKIMREVACDDQPLDEETYFETINYGLRKIGFEITWL